MPRKQRLQSTKRREYDDDFKAQTVQMLLDGHSASPVAQRLRATNVNLTYRWKQKSV